MIHGHDGDDDAAVELLCTATVTVTVDASTASAAAATANNSSLRSHTTTHAPRQAIPIAAAADHAIGPVVVPISVAVATTRCPRLYLGLNHKLPTCTCFDVFFFFFYHGKRICVLTFYTFTLQNSTQNDAFWSIQYISYLISGPQFYGPFFFI